MLLHKLMSSRLLRVCMTTTLFLEGMYKGMTHLIEPCKDFASMKSPKRTTTAPMQSIPVEKSSDCVCVDVLGPLPTSDLGNRYAVAFTSSLTK